MDTRSADTLKKLGVRKEKKAALNNSRKRAAITKAQEENKLQTKKLRKVSGKINVIIFTI